MNATMECTACGALFYSSGWREMLSDGESCTCGGELEEATSALAREEQSAGDRRGRRERHSGLPLAGGQVSPLA